MAEVTIAKFLKTKEEILYAEDEDTTPTSGNELFNLFMEALADHGKPFRYLVLANCRKPNPGRTLQRMLRADFCTC